MSNSPCIPKNFASPSARVLKKLNQLANNVVVIKEEPINDQIFPQKNEEKSFRKTHKVIKSNSNLPVETFSSASFEEDLAPTISSINLKKKKTFKETLESLFNNTEVEKGDSKPAFSEQFSLKSELIDADFNEDFGYSYSNFTMENIDEKIECKIEKNVITLQKTWKMVLIRRNYKKMLKKYKLAELLINAIILAQKQEISNIQMNNLERKKKKLEKFQERMIKSIRLGKKIKRSIGNETPALKIN